MVLMSLIGNFGVATFNHLLLNSDALTAPSLSMITASPQLLPGACVGPHSGLLTSCPPGGARGNSSVILSSLEELEGTPLSYLSFDEHVSVQ